MEIASPKLDTSHLSPNAEAVLRCQTASEQKDREDYQGVLETMRPLWRGVGHRPDITGLHESVAAEVLLCVGTLTGWIGSRNQIKGAQETAKNLLTESVTCYEVVGDQKMIAVAHVELVFVTGVRAR